MLEEGIDIITFDCYGTLIDWESGIATAFQSEAARDGVSLDRRQIIFTYMEVEPEVESHQYRPYRQVLAETAVRVASRLGWNIDENRAAFLAESVPSWTPFADTNAALERLAGRYELGILSNIDDDILDATRRHFTVDFAVVVTAEQVKSYKPGHAHFLEAKRRAGSKRLLHAAQSYFHDVVPASELGIPVVWVNRNAEAIPEGGPTPAREVTDLASLAEMLGV